MSDQWKRIAGVHLQEGGSIGVVWLGHDPLDGTIHVMDCCLFKSEVPIVIAEGINARGRWIPIAWRKKDAELKDTLQKRGCRMIPEPVETTELNDELMTREVWELMRTKRFKTNPRMAEWNDEYTGFRSSDGKTDAYPLMSATKYAVAQLKYARRQKTTVNKPIYPKVAMI